MMGQYAPMMGQQSPAMQYPPIWMQVPTVQEEELTPNSAARAARRHKRREYDNVAASRSSMAHKSNQLDVKPGDTWTKEVPEKMLGIMPLEAWFSNC
jgi:hypothetical protein